MRFSLIEFTWFDLHKDFNIFFLGNENVTTALLGLSLSYYPVEDEEDVYIRQFSWDACFLGLVLTTYRDIRDFFQRKKEGGDSENSDT